MYKEREGSANRHPDAQPVLEQIPPAPSLLDQGVPPMKTAAVKRKSTTSSGTITPATAAKNSRQKEAAMPAAPGNGLLSTEMFGGGSGNSDAERTAPTVIIDVPLNGESNKYVNFARLAEERYGFNALYPRLAVQRERLARVAAAGAALEKENKANGSGMSGDEMSVDLSEGEGAGDDSNVEMGGMGLIERDVLGAGRSPAEGSDGAVVKRKKRIMKEDQYDKDDPFVDDTELAWEEQQAASKDGFFVYSGPLVPEGEKPNVERYVILTPWNCWNTTDRRKGPKLRPNVVGAQVEVAADLLGALVEAPPVVEAAQQALENRGSPKQLRRPWIRRRLNERILPPWLQSQRLILLQ